jgi:hypothetical protein
MRLVCMRLVDMHKVHPEQATRACALCREPVGVYPSGQKALRLNQGRIEIVCQVCAVKNLDKRDLNQPAAPFGEILQEVLDSTPVKRA